MKARSQSSSTPKKRFERRATREAPERWTRPQVLAELARLADGRVRAQMRHFGVDVPVAHGISAPQLHLLAGKIGRNHALAGELWSSGIHEARILAAMIGEAGRVTSGEMNRWAADFDSWDVVDATCCYLYAFAAPAWTKVAEWSTRKKEFEKRAAFSLMAYLAYKDRVAPDKRFHNCLRIIEREAWDGRNFVRKAVNWALRGIGKRSVKLNRRAIQAARRIRRQETGSARWIAADALRELRSDAVQKRLRARSKP